MACNSKFWACFTAKIVNSVGHKGLKNADDLFFSPVLGISGKKFESVKQDQTLTLSKIKGHHNSLSFRIENISESTSLSIKFEYF